VRAAWLLGVASRALILSWIGALALPQMLEAQVGLSSGLAQVSLVARAAPRGSIELVGPAAETGHNGTVRDLSVRVRLTANTSYRLMVSRADASARPARVWVRTERGEWQALETGSHIVVGRGRHAAGEREYEVSYRVETSEASGAIPNLPVRYEMVIDPTI